jgi:hypothetical protein
MGETRGDGRRIVRLVIAAVAVSDLAYRMFMRTPLRRALGIEAQGEWLSTHDRDGRPADV